MQLKESTAAKPAGPMTAASLQSLVADCAVSGMDSLLTAKPAEKISAGFAFQALKIP